MEKFALPPRAPTLTDDFDRWPNFDPNVRMTDDMKAGAQVVEPYRRPQEGPCGFADCHQGHMKGFIVRFANGVHTNVGHVCGRNNFGAEYFDSQVRAIERGEREYEYKKRINALIDVSPFIRARAHDLFHNLRRLEDARDAFRQIYPSYIVHHLEGDAVREPVVRISRKLSDDEWESLGDEGASRYETTIKGTLIGVRGLAALPETRKSLFNVRKQLDAFEKMTTIATNRLSTYARLEQDCAAVLVKVEAVLDDAERFFTPKNFALFARLLDGKYEHRTRFIQWDFETMRGHTLSEGQLKRLRLKEQRVALEADDEVA